MFERFTDRARTVVVLAQEEARMLNHNYIGTEHILLGLIHEGKGVAAKALELLGISLEVLRQQVEEIIGQGQQAPSGHIPFTPRAKKVLELSLREALQLAHNYIGTEHILLGLIREGDGVAAQVLVKLGADLNRVRQQVIQLLHAYQGTSATPEPAPTPGGMRSIRLSKAMRQVVHLAAAEACALQHGYIGTEHLFLGLLLVDASVPPRICDLLDESVTVDAVRNHIVGLVGRGDARADVEFTPEATDALDLAECFALDAEDDEVDPRHLVIALAEADGSVALRVMMDLGMPDRAAAWARDLDGSAAEAQEGGRHVLAALARRSPSYQPPAAAAEASASRSR